MVIQLNFPQSQKWLYIQIMLLLFMLDITSMMNPYFVEMLVILPPSQQCARCNCSEDSKLGE